MSQTIVRLQGLELRNIKNVEFGKIEMPNSYQNERRYNNSEILGLYGQNGSGKTAVIDTMYFLQKFMTGESIEKKLTDYINMKKESAEFVLEMAAWILIAVLFVSWIGYSAYSKIQAKENSVKVDTVMDTSALTDYISGLSADSAE